MPAHTLKRFRSVLLGAAAAALVLTTTTALAGSGVGGVFNLGQVNTVDAQTSLSGNPGGNPELKVTSTGTAAAVRGIASSGIGTNGISTSGVGQQGLSTSGTGTLGTHGGTTGTSPGVQGETNSTDPAGAGVVGKNNGGGPGLKAIVNAGAPPLAVNSMSRSPSNLNADLLDGLDSAAFWKLGGNAGTTPGTNFLGTTDNQALELKVNGQRALRIEPNATSPNVIGGSPGNAVLAPSFGASVSGGGAFGAENMVRDNYGTVGGGAGNVAGDVNTLTTTAVNATVAGGSFNVASGEGATVGGGETNTAATNSSTVGGGRSNKATDVGDTIAGGNLNVAGNFDSTVGGGDSNIASGLASTVAGGNANLASLDEAAIGGGISNTASGLRSTVAGGSNNSSSGDYSAVPGGLFNTAAGAYSLAAGRRAQATGDGAFVWADGQDADVGSPDKNTFTVRAAGGIWLGTNSSPAIAPGHFIDTSTGGYLTSGGTWTNSSDPSAQARFQAAQLGVGPGRGGPPPDHELELQGREPGGAPHRPNGAGLLQGVPARARRQARHDDRRGRGRARCDQGPIPRQQEPRT